MGAPYQIDRLTDYQISCDSKWCCAYWEHYQFRLRPPTCRRR